jgi:hypothetical protein
MSVMRSIAQINQSKYFINVSSCYDAIYSVNPTTGTVATLQSQGTWFSTLAGWNNVSSAGQVVVKDMGRSIFLSTQSTVYRKVQFVSPVGSFGGVVGATGTTATAPFDYGTGYIELGWYDGNGGFGVGPVSAAGAGGSLSRTVWARTG